jgi:4-hydroxybenzoate polyprenyltransferase
MIASITHTSRRFFAYQNERFPVLLLFLSLFPVALSSAAVVSDFEILGIVLSFVASISYIFHIRVNDEERDFEHDALNHSTRPLHRGAITLQELQTVNIGAVVLFVLIAIFSGVQAVTIAFIMLVYSYFARHDFFCREKLRRHFFLYNIVHIVQIFLLQILVYEVIAHSVQFHKLLMLHFFFTLTGTAIFEFVRKLKIPGEDGSGKDTYTHYLGFNKSMTLYSFLILLNAIVFIFIAEAVRPCMLTWIFYSSVVLVLGCSICIHWKKKTNITDKLMQGTFLLAYIAYNVSIYIFIH